jgi:hypothetical protein
LTAKVTAHTPPEDDDLVVRRLQVAIDCADPERLTTLGNGARLCGRRASSGLRELAGFLGNEFCIN